jgi:hypothetical protein
VIGALCDDGGDLEARARENSRSHHFDVTIGYRYQSSSRHFIGTVEQTQREVNHNQVENDVHFMDIAFDYQLTPRWTLTGSLPIMVATRNQVYAPKGYYHVHGIGDSTVGVRGWLFRPPTESGGNIAFGVSLKMPTGRDNSADYGVTSSGQRVVATADQSIQLGDGGWGFSLETQAYRRIWFHNMLYFSGSYLFNPQDTNGVNTFRTRRGETVMSISDQYLYRGGIGHAVPKIRGLSATIGGRMEGVPVRDAFGKSNGFRRPGYTISVDPGLMYSRGRDLWSVNVPWAVERNRRVSVPDLANHSHGDAAFADYLLLFSYSRHF